MLTYSMYFTGLMGNIVDGIQRPLRVSRVPIRCDLTTLTDYDSPFKNYPNLYTYPAASIRTPLTGLFNGNSSPVPTR